MRVKSPWDKKIIVGMSGGVDSSMALVFLKKQGWQPIGVSLKLPVWQNPQNLLRENICCTKESLEIAQKICQQLDIPYHLLDVRADFKKEVIDYFVSELKNNRTPNPCIICNRHLKFKKLFEFAQKQKARYVATGHYARVRKNEKTDKFELLRAKDRNKDQSYALCFLPQKWLKHLVFPLGEYTKKEIYQTAKKLSFLIFDKKQESQDFCFVAGLSLFSFLKKEIGEKPGEIVDTKGNILGKHTGLHFFTIGQRRKLGLSGGPYFVKSLDTAKNTLIVTKNQREISQKKVELWPYHFISDRPPKQKMRVLAKVRYRQPLARATLFPPEKNQLRLVFDRAQRAVTPGQFAVFYQGEVCLGGGKIIKKTQNE